MTDTPEATGESRQPKPTPNGEIVTVFDTADDAEAEVVLGLLDTAGIEASWTGTDAAPDVMPGVGGVIVQVRAEDAEEARRVIEEYRNHPTTDSDTEVSGAA